jgi:nucleoside-diphosphate-sugar epimerase
MKIFVAGATGVLGRQLVPQLVARGHEVVGMTRSAAKQDLLRSLGARPVVADALDPDSVAQAVASAEPEVIVHQLTALSGDFDMRHIDRFFETTNRLRTEGTDHLLAAARAVGARRFVAQSYAGWPAERSGGPVKDENAPFDPDPPEALRGMMAAIRHLEGAVTGATWLEGVVLRYGGFYGPGTTLSADPAASHTAAIRKRQFPVVGDGGGIWSFIHVADSAASTTWWTTSPRRPGAGCPSWPACWALSRRGAFRAGSVGSWPAKRRP